MASFEDIKVGDEVIIDPPFSSKPRYVAKVERVTKKQFVAGGYRFRKDSGSQVAGDTWSFAVVHHPTPELLAKVNTENRYALAHRRLITLRNQLETVIRDIDRTYDKYQLTDEMEAAAANMAAAVTKLREAMP